MIQQVVTVLNEKLKEFLGVESFDSVRWLAGSFSGMRAIRRLFFHQPMKFCTSLIDQRRGELPRRLLPFCR